MQQQFNTYTITYREMNVLLTAGNVLISLPSYSTPLSTFCLQNFILMKYIF